MASSRFLSSRVLLVAIALIIASSAILTSMRLSVRVPVITKYIKWNKVPFSTTTASGLGLGLSSSMAPAHYKKPPQLPPKFTASPVSLIEQTKKLVCLYSHGVTSCGRRRGTVSASRIQFYDPGELATGCRFQPSHI